MNKPNESIFTTRPTVTLELPLDKHTRILQPEQVMLKIDAKTLDIGAYCYALRSIKSRKAGEPQEVITSSLIKQRPKHILKIIKALSSLVIDGGKSILTTGAFARHISRFIAWCDENNHPDCLAGGEATRNAFLAWATHVHERYRRQDIGEGHHNVSLIHVCELLESVTGLENLLQGIRKVRQKSNPNCGTEPLAVYDFAHAVSLNQCLFDGLCDLVLENQPFPYKLDLPASLAWTENHLWIFPTSVWRLPPHRWDNAIGAKTGNKKSWIYDYENGRLATLEEIEHRYKGARSNRRSSARHSIKRATALLDEANINAYNTWRIMMGMIAQRAFLFLFFCNTGGNAEVIRNIETDGTIDTAVQNQQYRGLKWRAKNKEVTLVAPASFMPRLRRFMELRKYLLQGRNTPYLFFGCGLHNKNPPARIGEHVLETHYQLVLTTIDPQLPKMGPRTLRASVDDYYLRLTDSEVTAAIMGHTRETENKKYGRGSANDHHREMSLFMEAVAESARRQRVIPLKDMTTDSHSLEQGGHCVSFWHPETLIVHAPVEPNCKNSQGCMFCNHRVLIAGEDDVRKVASAAYVMEQLILGPKHEEALRPSIAKCDLDLERIAGFQNCHAMVERVRKEVYDNENLTPFWADKYQLFLELGIIA